MAKTEKTRKLLWGHSGNRCAICRRELVVDATLKDNASVIGDECHIISGQLKGPRYDSNISSESVDEYENLLLLCKVHHKMIDDQFETYTTELLKQIKINHEKWVREKLCETSKELQPVRITRIKANIPQHLKRVTSGKELFSIMGSACGYYFDYDELESEEEVELIGSFLQTLQDWTDLYSDLDASAKVKVAYDLNILIAQVEEEGFYVFIAKEDQIIEGGMSRPSNCPVFHVRIVRKTNDDIIYR